MEPGTDRADHCPDPDSQPRALAAFSLHPGRPGSGDPRGHGPGRAEQGRGPGGRHSQHHSAPFSAGRLQPQSVQGPVHARPGHRPAGGRAIPGHRQADGGHQGGQIRRQPGAYRPRPRQHRGRADLGHPGLRLLYPQRAHGCAGRAHPHGFRVFRPAGPAHAFCAGPHDQPPAHARPGRGLIAHLGANS